MTKVRTIFLILATLNLTSILVYYLTTIKELQNSKTRDFLTKEDKEISQVTNRSILKDRGVFDLLGAYPEFKMSDYSYFPPKYETTHLGLYNDDDYCQKVDAYNMANPNNIFKKKNFFTDFFKGTLPRVSAMGKVGTIYHKNIDIRMNPKTAQQVVNTQFSLTSLETISSEPRDYYILYDKQHAYVSQNWKEFSLCYSDV